MTDIFISYSRTDKAMVSMLAAALEAQGYEVWWDHSLHGGQSFAREIHKQIDQAKCAIVVWSQASVESDWVYSEASHAADRGILLTTVYQDAPVPLPYNTRHNEDLRGWNGEVDANQFQKLLSAVEKYCPIPSVQSVLGETRIKELGGVSREGLKASFAKSKAKSWLYLIIFLLGLFGFFRLVFPPLGVSDRGAGQIVRDYDGWAESESIPVSDVSRLPFEPEMVAIPAGTFTMGCVEGRDDVVGGCYDDEKPAHEVTISKDFSIGKYEVTFDEWDACTDDGACPKVDDEGWGRGKRPVINVSWDDTQTYIGWLNNKTGKKYRLPTEAEWEYSARANSQTAFPWGSSINCSNANYDESVCGVGGTVEVGSYKANRFGLYDTVGNVWEWTQNWNGGYYSGSVRDPQGSQSGALRVVRGGSWVRDGLSCRSARRLSNFPSVRYLVLK